MRPPLASPLGAVSHSAPEMPSLISGETSPNPELNRCIHGVLETFPSDGAPATHFLSALGTITDLLVEEERRRRFPLAKGVVDPLGVHFFIRLDFPAVVPAQVWVTRPHNGEGSKECGHLNMLQTC